MRILGYDPGTPPTAALLVFAVDGSVLSMDFFEGSAVAVDAIRQKRNGRKTHCFATTAHKLHNIVQQNLPIDLAVIERVGIRQGENLASGAKFLGSMFVMAGVCVGADVITLMAYPTTWKGELGVPGKMTPKGKELIRNRAVYEFPDHEKYFKRQKDHNRAEAALIALWAYRHGSGHPAGVIV